MKPRRSKCIVFLIIQNALREYQVLQFCFAVKSREAVKKALALNEDSPVVMHKRTNFAVMLLLPVVSCQKKNMVNYYKNFLMQSEVFHPFLFLFCLSYK